MFPYDYDADGERVRLFSCSPGYEGTVLLQIPENGGNAFMTIDFWNSVHAFEDFQAEHGPRYATLDKMCAPLTTSERFNGSFTLLGSTPWLAN